MCERPGSGWEGRLEGGDPGGRGGSPGVITGAGTAWVAGAESELERWGSGWEGQGLGG